MTEPDVVEVDDTVPASNDQPVAPPAAPPGDFTTGAFTQSPSTWITAVTYLLPILGGIFHKDLSDYTEVIAQVAPVLATGILLIARNLHKREVIRANAQLAQQRLAADLEQKLEATRAKAALEREEKLALIAKLTPAQARKRLADFDALSFAQ